MALVLSLHLAWAGSRCVYAQELPPELSNLPALTANEEELVAAVRRFDTLQSALADWDLDMAKSLDENGDKDLAQMKADQARQRFALIRQAYEYGLKYYRGNPKLTNFYGELLYDRFGEFDYALRMWSLATVMAPDYGPPYNNLAIHSCHCGQYDRGLQLFGTALQLEPENPDYLFNLAQTYLVHGPQIREIKGWDDLALYNEAMRLSQRAVKFAPDDYDILEDYAVNFYAAENFGVQADWKRAAQAWQAARPYAPNDTERFFTWLNEGRCWIRAGDMVAAARCFDESLKICPDSDIAKQLLAEAQGGAAAEPRAGEPPLKP
ncbi:MAG: Tetratricopeptide repeat protein [Candidatus Hydrogenedentes bacterium]|nr:Tetratricopeptide repeat protein [Candidatus Hydrogenedentota bacterium]